MIARSREFELARSLVNDDACRGVLFFGGAGVGKTYLAEAFVDSLAVDGVPVWKVFGSGVTADIPLGAIAANLPADMVATGVAPSIALKQLLASRSQPTMVLLDDADMLDDPTAAALLNAADAGVAKLVVTQRSATLLPDSLARATRSGAITRIECTPFDSSATIRLAEHLAGGRLSPSTRDRIVEVTDGNPLYVREVVLAAMERGAVSRTTGGLSIDAIPANATRLVDLLAARLAGLSNEARDALTRVAAAELLGPGELASFADQVTLDQLELDGLVKMTLDDRRLHIRMGHPLHGEILRATQSPLRLRAIRAEIADAIGSFGARRRHDGLRLATWSLDGGRDVDPETLEVASRTAHFAGDDELAARLGRAAFERAPSYSTAQTLQAALYELGDFEPLEAHLEEWKPYAVTTHERATFAIERSASLFWRGAQLGGLEELVRLAAQEKEPGADRDEMHASAASLFAMQGRVREAVEMARPFVHGPLGRASIRAALAVGHGIRALGRPEESIGIVEGSLRAYRALGPNAVIMSYNVLSSLRTYSMAEAGRFDEAREAGAEGKKSGRDAGSGAGTALAHLACSTTACLSGRFDVADEEARAGERLLREANHPGMVRWAVGARAVARAQCGDREGAVAALGELEVLPEHPARIFANLEQRAAAWVSFLDGHTERAFDQLRAGAGEAALLGNVVAELSCWHDMARLGRPSEAVDAIGALADLGLEGTFLPNQVAHIRALAGGDLDELEACVERLVDGGTPQFAAEAADAAAAVAGRRGDAAASAAWVRRAVEHRGATGWTPLVHDAVTAPLTRREREIAMLAAQGVTSRDIGERLYISKRTVESHLGRLYPKLGVHDRAELAQLLNGRLAV